MSFWQRHYQNIVTALGRPCSGRMYYGLSLMISLAYTASLFPLDFFTGKAGFWFDVRTDPTQHITGLWAFLADQWRFPLLKTTLLNFPEGVSVAFTDSIPLVAVPFKLIAPMLPPHAHYFGLWVLLCYLLQGVAGAAFVGETLGRTKLHCLAGSLFAVMMPALMIRIPHAALLMHCLLIFPLAWYFQAMEGLLPARKATRRQAGALLLAAWIHPYWLAMVFPLYFVTHLTLVIRQKIRWAESALHAALCTSAIMFSLWIIGYFSSGGGMPPKADGFEINSMNLLSPLLGTHLASTWFLPADTWVLDATGLQIDGHNYLGMAVILLIAGLLLCKTREIIAAARRHSWLVLLMVGFTVYALSTKVYLSDKLVLSYSLPDICTALTGTFRASGRFFWPVGYLLLFGSLLLLLQSYRKSVTTAIILSLLLLQYLDTTPHRAYLTEAAHRKPFFKVGHADWEALTADAPEIHLLPAYGCGSSGEDALLLQYFASFSGVAFNTGFIARVHTDCDKKMSALSSPLPPKTFFLFPKGAAEAINIRQAMGPQFTEWCRQHPLGIVCKVGATTDTWLHLTHDRFELFDETNFVK